MERYEHLTKEQLIQELVFSETLIARLSATNGNLNTALTSATLRNENFERYIKETRDNV